MGALGSTRSIAPFGSGTTFWPPRSRKTAETARFGPSTGKHELMAATTPFFAENPFSPAVCIYWAGGTNVPF